MKVARGALPGGGEHLLPAARAMLERPPEERILFTTRDRWIEYPKATETLRDLSGLLDTSRQMRPMGRLLLGRADNGKSALLGRFAGLHPARSLDDGTTVQPVVLMQFPEDAQEYRFWSDLLLVLRIPHRVTDPSKVLKALAKDTLEALAVRMLVLDEVHNLMEGSGRQQSAAATSLKHLSNDLSLHLVVAGTQKAAVALQTDDQLSTRFEPILLPTWGINDRLRTLLFGLERTLPLPEPSGLGSKEMIIAMKPKAGDSIGGYVRLVQKAAVLAIRTGKPRIDQQLIEKAKTTTLKTLDDEDLKGL